MSIPHDYYHHGEGRPELRSAGNGRPYIDPDYVANDADDQLPMVSTIGRGPRGDGVYPDNIVEGEGEFRFDLVSDVTGESVMTTPNLSAGHVTVSQPDHTMVAGEVGRFDITVRKGKDVETFTVMLPPGANGSRIYLDKEIHDRDRGTNVYYMKKKDLFYDGKEDWMSKPYPRPNDLVIFTTKDPDPGGSYFMTVGYIANEYSSDMVVVTASTYVEALRGPQGVFTEPSAESIPAGQDPFVRDLDPHPSVAQYHFGIPEGKPAEMKVGKVTTLAPGENATVDFVLDSSDEKNLYTVNFGIPQGIKGDKGTFGTPTAESIAWDMPPTVTDRSNDPSVAEFHFGIPKGQVPTIKAGETVTLAPGNDAEVTIKPGMNHDYTVDFSIPEGQAGRSVRIMAGVYLPEDLPLFEVAEHNDAYIVNDGDGRFDLYVRGLEAVPEDQGGPWTIVENWEGKPTTIGHVTASQIPIGEEPTVTTTLTDLANANQYDFAFALPTKLSDGVIKEEHIADGSITSDKLADGATAAQLGELDPVVIGKGAVGTLESETDQPTAVGINAKASGFSVSIGRNARSVSTGIAIGNAHADNGMAIGYGANASYSSSCVAIGRLAMANASNAIAIGDNAVADESRTVSFGNPDYLVEDVPLRLRVVNIDDPKNDYDAATKKYVDGKVADVDVAVATTVKAGIVKPDGTTVKISSDGTISAFDVSADPLVMGKSAQGQGTSSVAIGRNAKTTGDSATAIGGFAEAAIGAIGIGGKATVAGTTAIGNASTASGIGALALGSSASATALRSMAIGGGSTASHQSSIAIGPGAKTTGDYQVNIADSEARGRRLSGVSAPTADDDAATKKYVDDKVAAGGGGGSADVPIATYETLGVVKPNKKSFFAEADGTLTSRFDHTANDVTIGENAKGSQGAVTIGKNATVNGGVNGVAIGYGASSAQGSLAILGTASEMDTITIGGTVGDGGDMSIGFNSKATGSSSMAIGFSASAMHMGSVAIGAGSKTNSAYQVMISDPMMSKRRLSGLAEPTADDDAATKKYVDKGYSIATELKPGIVKPDGESTWMGINGTIMAWNSKTSTIKIGEDASSINGGVAVGGNAAAGGSCVAVGFGAKASSNGIACGWNAYVTGNGSVAIGYDSQAPDNNQFSIGKPSSTRKLSFVSAPVADTDAANKKYVDDKVAAGGGGGSSSPSGTGYNMVSYRPEGFFMDTSLNEFDIPLTSKSFPFIEGDYTLSFKAAPTLPTVRTFRIMAVGKSSSGSDSRAIGGTFTIPADPGMTGSVRFSASISIGADQIDELMRTVGTHDSFSLRLFEFSNTTAFEIYDASFRSGTYSDLGEDSWTPSLPDIADSSAVWFCSGSMSAEGLSVVADETVADRLGSDPFYRKTTIMAASLQEYGDVAIKLGLPGETSLTYKMLAIDPTQPTGTRPLYGQDFGQAAVAFIEGTYVPAGLLGESGAFLVSSGPVQKAAVQAGPFYEGTTVAVSSTIAVAPNPSSRSAMPFEEFTIKTIGLKSAKGYLSVQDGIFGKTYAMASVTGKTAAGYRKISQTSFSVYGDDSVNFITGFFAPMGSFSDTEDLFIVTNGMNAAYSADALGGMGIDYNGNLIIKETDDPVVG